MKLSSCFKSGGLNIDPKILQSLLYGPQMVPLILGTWNPQGRGKFRINQQLQNMLVIQDLGSCWTTPCKNDCGCLLEQAV